MALNRAKMSDQEIERRDTEAKVLLPCVCDIYRQQLREGRYFLHEHPETARSWVDEQATALLGDPAAGSLVGHPCMYGQRVPTGDERWLPARMATHVWQPCCYVTYRMHTTPARVGHLHNTHYLGKLMPLRN